MQLILVRHGETTYNSTHRYTGQSDIPLSALGEHQTALVGEYLAKEPIDIIVSSDLQRTRAGAKAIARYHDVPVQEDADLREIAMGTWEGLTFTEVMERDADLVAQWRTDPSTHAPAGGETLFDLRTRIVRALARWQEQYPESNMVWVVHGGFIGVLLCHILQIDLNRRWQFRHENASITRIHLGSGYTVLASLNETAHLRTTKRASDNTIN